MTAPLGGRAGATTTLPRAYGEEGILAFDKEKQQLFTLVDSCVHNWQAGRGTGQYCSRAWAGGSWAGISNICACEEEHSSS
jgi:hypothetical protein